jgi:hypothetical protein
MTLGYDAHWSPVKHILDWLYSGRHRSFVPTAVSRYLRRTASMLSTTIHKLFGCPKDRTWPSSLEAVSEPTCSETLWVSSYQQLLEASASVGRMAGVNLLTRNQTLIAIIDNHCRRSYSVPGLRLSQITCGPPRAGHPSILSGRCRRFHLHARELAGVMRSGVCYDVHGHCTMHCMIFVMLCLLARASLGRVG